MQHSESSNPERPGRVESLPRRRSFDSPDLIDSSPRTPLSSDDVMEEENYACGDWVDKVMVNKDEGCIVLPELLLQNYGTNDSSVYRRQISAHRRHSLYNGLVRTRHEAAATDDSEELDAATSDSSELDYRCQLNVPHPINIPSRVASKVRIPSPKPKRGTETR